VIAATFPRHPRITRPDTLFDVAQADPGAPERLLDRLVGQRVFPGAALAVATSEGPPRIVNAGRLTYDESAGAVGPGTLWDLASVTKLLVPVALAMLMHEEGMLDLELPVAEIVPSVREPVTVDQLLSHTAGFPSWLPLFRTARDRQGILAAVHATPLVDRPGAVERYSDLGIILLGEVLEFLAREPIDRLARRRVLDPLGLAETTFCPDRSLLHRIAPTEVTTERGLIHGEVHDENALAMGGVAPHAGLFSTAREIALFGRSLLPGAGERLVSAATVRAFSTRESSRRPGEWARGVRLLARDSQFRWALLSDQAFGHTGFTGTLLVVDPTYGVAIALLTNHVYPSRDNSGIDAARALVLEAVMRSLDR
jgi:CubicO group peptidase (beta-lactamase class C family)